MSTIKSVGQLGIVGRVGGWFSAVKTYTFAHKFVSIIALLVILGGGWWMYAKATAPGTETRYTLGTVSTSTIISTVSESGQISSSDSVDIKAKVSGEITWIGVHEGQTVRAGQALMTIDNTDAKQAVVQSQQTLAADELQYQKDSAQAPADYQKDVQALATAKDDLSTSYNDTFNDLSGTYLDLPDVVSGANNALYGYDFDTSKGQWNMDFLANLFINQSTINSSSVTSFQASAKTDYATAKSQYDAAVTAYKTTTRTSTNDQIDTLLSQSITMTTAVAQALQTELNFYGAVSDLASTYKINLPSKFTTLQSTARTNLATVNGDISTLLSDKKTLDSAKQAITNDQQTITLDQVGNTDGTNPISLQISANNIEKEKTNLANLQEALADYTVVAPFAGTISAVDVKVGDTSSAAVATIITNQQIVDLSVNEVDATKIAVGQKATLTFDAIDGLTLTGTVAQVDTVGTVSQGVVSYTVEITLDTQDSRIKPGMTVNATIQSAVHQSVLVVPSTAVKTTNGVSYVQVFNPPLPDTGGTAGVTSSVPPTQVLVTTGISDDTNIEILSGLTAGEQIVTKTTTGTATAATRAPTATTGAAGATRGGNAGFGGGAAIRL